jgi:thiol-disulfide isomerase/thioredoxin
MTVRAVRLVAIGCMAGWVLAACGGGDPSLPAGVAAVSGHAPALPGVTLNGGRVPDLGGKVVVVNFWNPYCPPCRVEAPALEAAARRYANRGVQVVGVHYTGQQWPKSVSAALSFVRAAHLTYPVVGDPGARLATEFGIAGIPTTVIVDGTGRMRFRVSGPVKAGVLDDLLARALERGAGGS